MSGNSIMLVAGEASGDHHAASLLTALAAIRPHVHAFGFGGPLMAKAGMEVVHDLTAQAVIGIMEAIRKLGKFYQILQRSKTLLRERRPNVLVLVDLPDLNFRIAAQAKALGIPVVYYISPQVWAWRSGRIKTLKRLVDHMLVILPFEEPIYQKAGIPVTFVGHPLVDNVQPEEDLQQARQRLLQGHAGPLIALVPGSRYQEIELLLPTMLQAGHKILEQFPEARFFIPLARTVSPDHVNAHLQQEKFSAEVIVHNPFAARAAADLAIVSSGTATLETALLGVPMIIGYRMHPLSYQIARWFVKLPYFGLANLVAGEKIAPEFLQDEFHALAVAETACQLLNQPEMAERQRQGWKDLRLRLGGSGATRRAAEIVAQFLPA